MVLSDTLPYKKWISQFSDSDKKTAKLLVDSIKYIDEDTFIKGLYESLISTTNKEDVYALFAVREKEDVPFFQIYTSQLENEDTRNVSYNRISPTKSIGSEGDIAHFIRDITRKHSNFLDTQSLEIMKNKKCRHIIFIDDFSGTGTQINDFIEWFYENKTIKSWFSLGYIDFIVHTYAITERALKCLKSNKKINKINFEVIIEDGSSLWNTEEYYDVKNLCITYGKLFKIPKNYLLGYKESFSLIMFSHKCPNNVPGILWYSKSKNFVPLVNYRPNFDFKMIESFLYSFSEIIKRLNYSFTRKKQIDEVIKYNTDLLLILKFLNKRKFNKILISKSFNISVRIIDKNISLLLKNGWIDSNSKITKEGKRVLLYFKKKDREEKPLEEKNDFYYPLKLRAPV